MNFKKKEPKRSRIGELELGQTFVSYNELYMKVSQEGLPHGTTVNAVGLGPTDTGRLVCFQDDHIVEPINGNFVED